MNSLPVRFPRLNRSHRRSGMMALTEIIVIVAALMVVWWTGSRVVSLSNGDMAAHAATSRACSDRPVYRLSMEESGKRLWIFRPAQEVAGLSLRTEQIDKVRSQLGVALMTAAHSRDGTTSLLVTHGNALYLEREGSDPVWKEFPGEISRPVDVAVSNDGSVAIAALSDGIVRGWMVIDSRAEAFEYRLPNSQKLVRMCMDGDGLRILVAYRGGQISIHEARTGKSLCDVPNETHECTAAAWSVDGRQVAIATTDGAIGLIDLASCQRVWDTKSGNLRRELMHVATLAISPDGCWIAAGGLSPQCYVWNVAAPTEVHKLSGHDGLVRAVAFAPHEKRLYTGGLDGTIREWSLETLTSLRTFE